MNATGSITTPLPTTQTVPSWKMPDGMRWSTNVSSVALAVVHWMVWPALAPPWYRATMSTSGASRSTTLPLPSSPHCAPMMMVTGIA